MFFAKRARRCPATLDQPSATPIRSGFDLAAPEPVRAHVNEGELAWKLATELASSLPPKDRTIIYLSLGCGDHFDAIVHLLQAVGARQLTISDDIAMLMDRWRGGYVGSSRGDTVDQLVTAFERRSV